MRHPELPIVSFLCIAILLCSLPSHIRARSVSTISLIAWLAVMSLIRGVNALLWANNFEVKAQVWCDIATKITIGFTYAVPAAALCILRHLESVASTRSAQTMKNDKRRRQIFEACMCFGVPMFFMALHYVVQGHRYDLFEDFGCYPSVYFSIASIIIIWVPPLLMSFVTFIYAALSLRHFLKHRIEFAAHLRNSQSAISPGRYFRLMSMAIVEMVWDTGINSYIIWFNTLTGLRPWISWDDVHSNFSRVGVFPQFLNPPAFLTQLIWQWWIIPISCFFFFIFFAFGEEAIADYRAAFNWFRRTILRHNVSRTKSYTSRFALPSYRTPATSAGVSSIVSSRESSSEHKSKEWDELSLKMSDNIHSATEPWATVPFDNISRPSPSMTIKNTEFAYEAGSITLSSHDRRRATSIYTTDSSFTLSGYTISGSPIVDTSPHVVESTRAEIVTVPLTPPITSVQIPFSTVRKDSDGLSAHRRSSSS